MTTDERITRYARAHFRATQLTHKAVEESGRASWSIEDFSLFKATFRRLFHEEEPTP